MTRTGYYAGSFDPYTIGHADITERALVLFDRIIIGVGVNMTKTTTEDLERRLAPIRALYAHDSRITVEAYSCLTSEAARAAGATALIRSVRNVKDYEYEQNLADVNRRLSGLETVIFTARPELACVSSSLVRELRAFGLSGDEFLPHPADSNTKDRSK